MKKILLFLANGFEILEASAFIDVCGWNLIDGDGSTKLFSCALKKQISSSFNQKFIVDFLIDDIDINEFDALAIPGGFEEYGYYEDAFNPKFLNVIMEFYKQNKIIASICVGALPLGKCGLLNNQNATTYVTRQKELSAYGVNVVNKPIVFENNIITSCGPSTAIDVAMMLLKSLTNKENTQHIRKIMGFVNK
jgi:4-methyl-5(b-hydroxyethyl)-thiazole monophosphate biosynthesis